MCLTGSVVRLDVLGFASYGGGEFFFLGHNSSIAATMMSWREFGLLM
jgi:hypothetical protein